MNGGPRWAGPGRRSLPVLAGATVRRLPIKQQGAPGRETSSDENSVHGMQRARFRTFVWLLRIKPAETGSRRRR
jgi:hypothetical protein